MKRLISLIVTITMLAGMCITAGAALPTTASYTADMADGTMGAYDSAGYDSVVSGYSHGLVDKYGDKVAKTQISAGYVNSSGGRKSAYINLPAVASDGSTYTDYINLVEGEKVHLSSEIYIPTGSVYNGRNGSPSVTAKIWAAEAGGTASAKTIGVKNDGISNYNTNGMRQDAVVTFDVTSGKVVLFGQQVYTTFEWEWDTWYTVDVVIVAGSRPQAAVYVNGLPLILDPTKHGDNADPTFDGSKITSDYVNIGYRTYVSKDEITYSDATVYGVVDYCPLANGSAGPTLTKDVATYVDNMSYQVLAANAEPAIYRGFALDGVTDGGEIDRAKLANATVNIPKWDSYKVSKVTVSVDGATALEDTTAPYTFDLSKVERGIRVLTLTAYDAANNVVKSAEQTIVVNGNELVVDYENDFNSFTAISDFRNFYHSSRNTTTGWEYTLATIPEGQQGASDGQFVKMSVYRTSEEAAEPSTLDTAYGCYSSSGVQTTLFDKGVVRIGYDFYIDNNNVDALSLAFGKAYQNEWTVLSYDKASGKFKPSTSFFASESGGFAAAFADWQRWEWVLDFTRGVASLYIDGAPKLVDCAMSANGKTGFRTIEVWFNNKSTNQNFVGWDNLKITRETALTGAVNDMYDYTAGVPYSTYDDKTIMSTIRAIYSGYWPSAGSNGSAPASGYVKAAVVKDGEDVALNESFGESLLLGFDAEDTMLLPETTTAAHVGILKTQLLGSSSWLPQNGITTMEYDLYIDNLDFTSMTLQFNSFPYLTYTPKSDGSGCNISINNNKSNVVKPTGSWLHHKLTFNPAALGASPEVALEIDGTKVYVGPVYNYDSDGHYAPWYQITLNPKAQETDTTKTMPTYLAFDNIEASYTPVVPYISGVSFADGAAAGNKVKADTTSVTVDVTGYNLTELATKLTVTEVGGDGTALGTAAVSGNTVTFSDLALTADKQYKVALAEGLSFDAANLGMTTYQPSTYYFTAVSELPVVEVVTPVAGVEEVIFTKNGETYTGDGFAAGNTVSAEIFYNNTAATTKTFRAVIALYDADEKLQSVSIGDCVVSPYGVGRVVSAGTVKVIDPSDMIIKAFLIDDMATLAPMGGIYTPPAAQ